MKVSRLAKSLVSHFVVFQNYSLHVFKETSDVLKGFNDKWIVDFS